MGSQSVRHDGAWLSNWTELNWAWPRTPDSSKGGKEISPWIPGSLWSLVYIIFFCHQTHFSVLKTWMCPCSAKMAFHPFLALSLTHIQLPVSLPVATVHSMLILLTSSPWHWQEQMQHPNKHCSAAPSPSEARPRAHTRVPGKLELGQARAGSPRLPLSLKDFTEYNFWWFFILPEIKLSLWVHASNHLYTCWPRQLRKPFKLHGNEQSWTIS